MNNKNKITFHFSYISYLGIFLTGFILYFSSFKHQFVLMDDALHLMENPNLNPISFQNLLHFWKEPYQGLYIPITYHFWALLTWITSSTFNPEVYHIANVCLHLINSILVFELLKILTPQNRPAQLLGALFFAVHPVQVESVAWVSGTKDTLSSLFALLTLIFSLKKHPQYFFSTIFFLLAILSKPATVIIPILYFILHRFWMKKEWRQSFIALLWMILSSPILYLTKTAQPNENMRYVAPILGRVFVMADTIVFYFSKVLYPIFLVPDYARHPKVVLTNPWGYAASIFLLTFLLWIWKKDPKIKIIIFLFITTLIPVLGIVPFFFQFFSTVADRYLYLALLFPALGVSYLVSETNKKSITLAVISILILFSSLTFRQVLIWKNNETLFEYLVKINPNSLLGHNNLGTLYENEGRYDEAKYHYEQAIRVYPNSLPGLYNLGRMKAREKKYIEAIYYLEKLLKLEPNIFEAHYTLGIIYREIGQIQKALQHGKLAANHLPLLPRAHYQLGVTFAQANQKENAKLALSRTLKLDPNNIYAQKLLTALK